MFPWGVQDIMEELDAHRSKLWSSEDNKGPVSGCAGQAHDASQLQEPALGNLKTHRYSVQHSYAKGARRICMLSGYGVLRGYLGY